MSPSTTKQHQPHGLVGSFTVIVVTQQHWILLKLKGERRDVVLPVEIIKS